MAPDLGNARGGRRREGRARARGELLPRGRGRAARPEMGAADPRSCQERESAIPGRRQSVQGTTIWKS